MSVAPAIAGFVSRDDWGAALPRSFSRDVHPERGGVGVHYGGDTPPPHSHAGCVATWRGWQRYHQIDRGWADVAYSFGFCNHGYVFAGRGFGVRTAANGTDDGNERFLAACWIGGGTDVPTPEAHAALAWIISEARRLGAGREVRPHRYFKSTTCPGVSLAGTTALFHNRDIVNTQEEEMSVATVKQALHEYFIAVASREDKAARHYSNAFRAAVRAVGYTPAEVWAATVGRGEFRRTLASVVANAEGAAISADAKADVILEALSDLPGVDPYVLATRIAERVEARLAEVDTGALAEAVAGQLEVVPKPDPVPDDEDDDESEVA